jgi:hypothetical protein
LAAVNGSLDLSSVQRAVAISIGLHFNITDGRCDPGYEAIAGGTPYKRRAVITAVSDLAAKGWIVITPSRGRHRNSLELTTPSNSAHMHAPTLEGYSYAEIERVCTQAVKAMIIDRRKQVQACDFNRALEDEARRRAGQSRLAPPS